MATDLDMALSGSVSQDFTTVAGGRAGYSHQAVPLHPHISNSPLLMVLNLSISLCTPDWHILVAPAASGCLLPTCPTVPFGFDFFPLSFFQLVSTSSVLFQNSYYIHLFIGRAHDTMK